MLKALAARLTHAIMLVQDGLSNSHRPFRGACAQNSRDYASRSRSASLRFHRRWTMSHWCAVAPACFVYHFPDAVCP